MGDTQIVAPGGASEEPRGNVSYAELQRHTNRSSLWVLIGGTVYNVTSLLSSHPGGTGPLFKYAGKDATWAYPIYTPLNVLMLPTCSKEFMQIHPPDALDMLPHSVCIGPIDPTTVPRIASEPTAEESRIAKAKAALPHPRSALNLLEIEVRTTPQVNGLFGV
jgi:L-lactate dehydrogenase (cytochrome)